MQKLNIASLGRTFVRFRGWCRLAVGAVASIAVIAWMNDAVAQEAQESGDAIDEIIVSAQKRDTLLQDTAATISVFTDEMLGVSDIENVDDIQFYLSNVAIKNEIFAITFIRGIGSTAFGVGNDPSSTMHIDGVYIPRTSGVYSDFWDVERIEVLKGPQGTLYGRNTTGGSVNIITKMPTEEFEAGGAVTLGDFNKRRFDATISGPLSDNVQGRMAVLKNDRDGSQEDIVRDRRTYQDENVLAGRGTIAAQLSDKVELLLRADYLRQRETGSTFVEDILDRPDDLYDVSLDGPQNYDYDNVGASATLNVGLDQLLGGTTWTTMASWRETDLSFIFDNDGTGFFKRNTLFGEDSESVHVETQLLSSDESTSRLQWIAGLFFFSEDGSDSLHQDFLATGPQCAGAAVPNPDPAICPVSNRTFLGTIETTAYAAFGQLTYSLTDRLRLTLGTRYSYEEKDFASDFLSDGVSTVGGFVPETGSWSDWTPNFAIDYHVSEDVMVWASASRGFKSGGFSLLNLGRGASLPEFLWAYEVGIKGTLMDDRLIANLSGFIWEFTNLQTQGFNPETGEIFLNNAGKASNDGFELEIIARPIEGLDLNLAAGYLDAQYDLFVTLAGVDHSGNKQPHSPEWSLSAGGQYTFQLKNTGSLTFRGEVQKQDEFFFGANNVIKSEPFTRINAAVFLDSADGHWRFGLYGKNLTDEVTIGSRSQNNTFSPNPANSNLVAVGEPRQWGLRIEFNY